MILHAPKNGFFFVIDRTDGKFISAKKFVDVNWATGYDASGRPIETPIARVVDRPREITPTPFGARNWHPMSYSPATGLAYMPVHNVPINLMDNKDWTFNTHRPGEPHSNLGWNVAMFANVEAPKSAPFGRLVASGLEARRLPMKLLFKPGTVNFNDLGDLPTQYKLWLATMAREAGKSPACMKVVGHTSRTGSASANEHLSLRRAEAVSKLLEGRDRSLRSRLSVGGVGSREALIGLGTDDPRDALDRRVEFRVVDCI